MSNQSVLTRKEQVLWMLRRNANQWVDGPDLASERIGGSEGLKRLRELRSEGHRIQQRRHPNPERDIWQYRLVIEQQVAPLRQPVNPQSGGLRDAVKQNPDGTWDYTPPEPGIEPVTAEVEEGPLPEFKFTEMPSKVDFGAVAICPRCHSKTNKHKWGSDTIWKHKDPYIKGGPCRGCGGWGIVPNKGAIAVTMPEGMK